MLILHYLVCFVVWCTTMSTKSTKRRTRRPTGVVDIASRFPGALRNIHTLAVHKLRLSARLTIALLHVALRYYSEQAMTTPEFKRGTDALLAYFGSGASYVSAADVEVAIKTVQREIFDENIVLGSFSAYASRLKPHEGLVIHQWVHKTPYGEALDVLSGDLRALKPTFMKSAMDGAPAMRDFYSALLLLDKHHSKWRSALNAALRERNVVRQQRRRSGGEDVDDEQEQTAETEAAREFNTVSADDYDLGMIDTNFLEVQRLLDNSRVVTNFVGTIVQMAEMAKMSIAVEVQQTGDTSTPSGQNNMIAAVMSMLLASAQIEDAAKIIVRSIIQQVVAVRDSVVAPDGVPEGGSDSSAAGARAPVQLELLTPAASSSTVGDHHPIASAPGSPMIPVYITQGESDSPIRRMRDSLGAAGLNDLNGVRKQLLQVTRAFLDHWSHHESHTKVVNEAANTKYISTRRTWCGERIGALMLDRDRGRPEHVSYDAMFAPQVLLNPLVVRSEIQTAYAYLLMAYKEQIAYCNTLCSLREHVELTEGVLDIIRALLDNIQVTYATIRLCAAATDVRETTAH